MIEIKPGQHYITNKDHDDKPHTVLVVLGKTGDKWLLSAEAAGKKVEQFSVEENQLRIHLAEKWHLIFDSSESNEHSDKRNRLEEVE